MSSERHATRTPTDACYRLVARVHGQAHAIEVNGFASIPEAQSKVAEFVLAAARLGDIAELCLEKRSGDIQLATTQANDPPAQVVKRWNQDLVRRILLQYGVAAPYPAVCESYQPGPIAPETKPRDPVIPAKPSSGIDATPPVQSSVEVVVAEPLLRPEAVPEAPFQIVEPYATGYAIETSAKGPQATSEPAAPIFAEDPIQQLADEVGRPTLTGTVLMDVPLGETGHRTREVRPPLSVRSSANHRRTRWDLTIAIALIVVVAFGILLLDTDGDPLGLFHARVTSTAPRESLPFPVRPPASRAADSAGALGP